MGARGRASALAALMAAVAILAPGCGGGDSEEPETGASGATGVAGATGPAGPGGGFELAFEEPAPGYGGAERVLRSTGVLENLVGAMNDSITLEETIRIRANSNPNGPFYNPAKREIVLSYPFAAYVAGTFANAYPRESADRIALRTVDVMAFVLLHEMGHALVHRLDLPITGREEDAVDQLATTVSLTSLRGGLDFAVGFADFFALAQRDPALLRAVDFWDEHSLDIQRANETICLVYGWNPRRAQALARFIPASRRFTCPRDWRQVSGNWLELLEPHLEE